jgi:hypothetical protein
VSYVVNRIHCIKGFNIAHNADKPMLDVLGDDPFRATRFAETMSLFNSRSGTDTKAVVENYDWASLPDRAVVVDVRKFSWRHRHLPSSDLLEAHLHCPGSSKRSRRSREASQLYGA